MKNRVCGRCGEDLFDSRQLLWCIDCKPIVRSAQKIAWNKAHPEVIRAASKARNERRSKARAEERAYNARAARRAREAQR